MKVVVALALFLCVVSCQTMVDRILIDNFDIGENNIIITIPSNPNFPITDTSIYTDSGNPVGLLGGERDLQLTVESGPAGRLLFSQVLDGSGEWNTATPNSASGFALLQWDGKDNALTVSNNGLNSMDLTEGGLGTRIHAEIETDVDTIYTFTVYSSNGNTCDREVTIPGGAGSNNYFLDFSTFTGNCDFTSVGAIELLVEAFDNVDSIITLVATNGIEQPSPSRTPTRTPSPSTDPSPSRTPTRTPSPSTDPSESRTPTPSPTPSPISCYCEVPVFRCEQVFERNEYIQGIRGIPPQDLTSLSSYYTSFSTNNDDDDNNIFSNTRSSSTVLAPLAIFAALVALML